MKEPFLFNAYRYLIKISDDKYNMSHYVDPYPTHKKEKLLHDFLINLKKGIKHEFVHYNNKYLVYYRNDINENFYLLKLAKKREVDLYVEGEMDLEEISANNFPPIYIVIDKNKQIILIQHESQVFKSSSSAANALRTCFNDYAKEYHYEVTVDSINKKDSFWKIITNYSNIKKVDFKFHSPNFFDGLIEFNKIAKMLKEKYNNTMTNIIFKNDNDKLTLDKSQEELIEMLEYINEGGGSWSATVIENDKKVTKKSEEYAKKVFFEGDLNKYFENDDNVIYEKFNEVDDVSKDE